MMRTAEGQSVSLEGWYRGKAVFFLGNGPSLAAVDLPRLTGARGVVTAGTNNGWLFYRPDLWFCVDDPDHFADVGWKDPGIVKFVPLGKVGKKLRVKREDGTFRESKFATREMPACWFYPRNTSFNPATYLTEDTVNWGCEGGMVDSLGVKGSRSVMLAAMRILIYLGFRRIFLLGCDFNMESGAQNYAFPQGRSSSSVRNNNGTFAALNARFDAVWPQIQALGVRIWNCTPNSGLKPFPFLPFEEALKAASKECSKPVDSMGWYDPRPKGKKKPK